MSLEKTTGEVSAIVGYFFQYEIFATEIYNHLLSNQLEWVEFASQEAGKLDDVLIGTKDTIIAYQTKQIGSSSFSYREFTNADPESVFQGIFKGWKKISDTYPSKKIDARFITTQNISEDDSISGYTGPSKPSFEKFVRNFWKPIQSGTYDSQSIPVVWQPVFDELVKSAPFEHQSGTSIKGRTRVSSLSNKQLKKLIHMVAICACAYNPEMKSYYKRRVSEGKNKMSTLNVIRNKIISRMFAVVNRGSGYVDLMKYAA